MGIVFRSLRGNGDEPCYREDERDWHEGATLSEESKRIKERAAMYQKEVDGLVAATKMRCLEVPGVGWARDPTDEERAEHETMWESIASRGRPSLRGARVVCVVGSGAHTGGVVFKQRDGTILCDQFQGGHWPRTVSLLRDAWLAKYPNPTARVPR